MITNGESNFSPIVTASASRFDPLNTEVLDFFPLSLSRSRPFEPLVDEQAKIELGANMATVLEQPTFAESEIWTSAVKGDTKAFEQVVISHQSAVSAVAFSIVGDFAISQDIAQETFWAAWKSRDSLRDAKRLGAWLCGIARNLAKQWNRKKSRRQEVSSDRFGGEFDSYGNDPADEFVSREEESVVWGALEKIPQNYREVLVLYYRQGQSIGQVADSLGIANDAARQRLSRGREILRSRVSNLIEGVLDRTNPTRTFTSRVMAGIVTAGVAGSSSTAKAGVSMAFGSSTATSAATVAKVLGTGSAIGILGGLLGAGLGFVGAWFGTWFPAQMAPTETEKHLLLERGKTPLRIGAVFTISILAIAFAMSIWPNAWPTWLIAMVVAQGIFAIAITLHGNKTQRLVKALRKEISPDEDPNLSKIGTHFREKEKKQPIKYGRRYTSEMKLLGLPLFDIQINDPPRLHNQGNIIEPVKARTAKGWVAIGDRAIGVIAIGGFPVGVISIGGMACGVFAIGGLSLGIFAFGGLAAGGFAIGGLAIGYTAIGGGAIAWHSATGGGAVAWHAATGGGACAHDFAVGGGAYANEANTELAKQVIDEKCHMQLVQNTWLFPAIGIAVATTVPILANYLYTTTPPEIVAKKT